MSKVKARISFDGGATRRVMEFDGAKCDDGMAILLWIEKKAGGPPEVDERWDALQQDIAAKKREKR